MTLSTKSLLATLATFFCTLGFCLPLQAASFTGTGEAMLVQPGTYGGCAATFSIDPQTVDPGCDTNWMTFDCDGNIRSKTDSARMWEVFQLGKVTGANMRVIFGSSQKINGKCLVRRLDILP